MLTILIFTCLLLCFLAFIITFFTFCLMLIELEQSSIKPNALLLAKACLKEYLLLLSKFIFFPLAFYPFKAIKSGQHAIILIHGYTRNQTDLLYLGWYLAKHTDSSIFYLNLASVCTSIEAMALALQNNIARIQAKYGHNKYNAFTLIGHSMGGIVAAYTAENLNINGYIKKVITIGTPISGTKLATLGIGENTTQIMCHSSFLKSLHERISNSQNKYLMIASTLDNFIVPWHNGFLNLANCEQVIIQNQSHLGLLFDKRVFEAIVKNLKETITYRKT